MHPVAVVHLFGPMRVVHEGSELEVGGPRERSLLAALALAAERPVSVDRLVAWMWGDEPPATARKSVQNAVMLLRRAVDRAGLRVERVGDGYALRLGPASLDTGDPGPGRPLASAGETEAVRVARARLEELRAAAVERRLAQRVALDPDAVVAELRILIAEEPYREPLRALLMQAHYQAGRQHEALQAYQEAREVLRGGLGVEPGPALRTVHRAVLAQDPALLAQHATVARSWLADGAARAGVGDVAGATGCLYRAVAEARAARDVRLVADAAAALAGDAQWLLGDAEVEALLEEALRRLPDERPDDRARVGRAATGLALARATRGDPRARGHAAEAVRRTANAAEPVHRTAALFAQAVAWEGPDDVEARRRHGAALLHHGVQAGDPVATAFGHQYLSWAALESGDGAAAAAGRAAMFAAAADSPHPHLAAQVADTRFLDAVVSGRLADAAACLPEIGAAWRRSANPEIAAFIDLSARMFLGELTGGLDHLLPEFEQLRAALPGDVAWPLATALAHGLAGRTGETRAALAEVEAADLWALPRSTLWTGYVSGAGWAVDLSGRADLARVVLDLLQPLGHRHLVLGSLHHRGSAAHWQGVCHRALGDPAAAERRFRRSLAEHEAVRCPPWIALSAAALATVLPADSAERRRHLRRARSLADQLGMTGLSARLDA